MLKDPELKLFGRMISLPENRAVFAAGEHSGESSNESSNGNVHCDRCSDESKVDEAGGDENPMQKDEEQAEGEVCETSADNEDEDPEGSGNTTNGDESGKSCPTDDQPKKDLKKPDKILPCPRCKSMDTKFCYYNNYNANQPRHFCKSCQRYWTAGGTMRNVPVGAGRRKNKNSASHCRHITISEALQAADPAHNLKFKPNGTVLSFGPDSPLCDSMASSLSLAEKTVLPNDGGRNGFQQPAVQNMTGFPPPVPCIPWSFPWNPAVPLPAIFPPYSLPLSYYPAPYIPCAWNLAWPSPTANQKVAASNPSSPLGKHSRNGELLNANTPKSSESSIVVPRTLRIDDPEEAAKSSIWSTLGIKYDSISREGLFKALQPKIDDKKPIPTANPLLQANPAALSRSLAFQETA